MLDDGCKIINRIVYSIKNKNSTEIRCNYNRAGNYFLKNQTRLITERHELGTIKLLANKIYLTWLGCTQEY